MKHSITKIYLFDRILIGVCLLLVAASFVRIHLRVQSTVLSYRIGALKDSEKQLLDRKNALQMELARSVDYKSLKKYAAQ